ncbi:MAG: hypothetical protein B7X41_09705, partial [Microbacterium sp. 14-71-5]
RHNGADLSRGLGAAIALLGFVAGVPAALVALAPVYLPNQVPSWGQLWERVTSPDDGSLLLVVLGLVAWACWAAFTASVLLELAAAARRLHAPTIPMLGGFQRTAARMIATASLLVASASALAAPATPAGATALVADFAPAMGDALPAPADVVPDTPVGAPTMGSTRAAAAPTPQAPALPSVTVQRGDTLWDLAERHLGDPLRYTEIRDLNIGRTQPDGTRLRDADFIQPGWTLLLPADATDVAPEVQTVATTDGAEPSVVVQPGDTLWGIAAQHLGDGARYTELLDLNRGKPQPDGGQLSDPDHIRPGWVLRLPARAQRPSAITAAGDETAALRAGPIPPPASLSPSPQETTGPSLEPQATAPAGEFEGSSSGGRDARQPAAQQAEHQPTAAWFLGLAALGAAGIVGELTRRRHLQQRARRVGETIPMPQPTSPAAAAERTLRTAATPVSIDAIRTTLHNIASRCYTAGADLPRLAALLLDERHLTLLLLEDAPEATAPFTATEPRTWVASTQDVAAEEEIDDPGQGAPYPLLVTLGHTEDATLILNLEAAGTLAFVGDATAANEALRALVVEAATSDLASQLPIHTDETFADLTDAFEDFRLRATDARDDRVAWVDSVSRLLAGRGLVDVLSARARREFDDVWLPTVFIEAKLAAPASQPWSGAVTLTLQDVDTAWTVRVDAAGRSQLWPLDITFEAQRLTSEHADSLRSLLVTALPPQPHPENALRAIGVEETAAALRAVHPVTAEPTPAGGVRLNVLGPIQVEGIAGRPLTPRTVELLAYLALHGPATGPDLDEMLWKGERGSANTRNVFIRRARERLGEAVLPAVGADGLFRLGTGIETDWARFQRHLTRALALDGQDQVEELAAAMALVRDRPFRGIAPTAYIWADHDLQTMVSAIADAAGLLARLHNEAGRHREAIRAATLGLVAEPCSDELQTIAIAATREQSGPQEAMRLRRRYAGVMARLDPELA